MHSNNPEFKIEKAYVYVIKCNIPNILDCYIGSTCNLIKREQTHGYNCKYTYKNKNNKLYSFVNDNGGFDNFQIEVLKIVYNITRKDLKKIERDFIIKYKPSLNCNLPGQTMTQWRAKNRERLRQNQQKYNLKSREIQNAKRLQYSRLNKEKLSNYTKFYYMKNKDKLKQKGNQEITCICGHHLKLQSLITHKQSNIHKRKMQDLKTKIIEKKYELTNNNNQNV